MARALYPDRPGALDLPAWDIGRRWCRPVDPDCPACPVNSARTVRTHLDRLEAEGITRPCDPAGVSAKINGQIAVRRAGTWPWT